MDDDDDDNMQPLQAFANRYVKCDWRVKDEFVIQHSELQRWRISIEDADRTTIKDGFLGIWRSEKLADRGIDVTCADSKEFAEALLNGPFEYLSPHDIMHVITVLQTYIDEWHQERKAAFMANPEVFGKYIPTDDEKTCQG